MNKAKGLEVSGRVVKGDGYGRVLGFPTANLDRREYKRKKLKIRLGIWAGKAEVFGHKKKAGIVIGPIDKSGLPKIEAHIIGFKGSLYREKMILELYKFLRPFKKYKSEKELKDQIKKDIRKIKSI